MRHDGSHISTGFGTTVIGEIHNQTYDFAANALAQYGVFPNMDEQYLNRRVIYSFYGLPPKLEGLQRDWKEFQLQALETWRMFLVENPAYAEKWELNGFLDSNMRMVKSDGSPIISEQTGEQQIPVIDYTDLAVLRHLEKKLMGSLTDAEVQASMPYDLLYKHMMQSTELLSMEYILRDGAQPVLVNGIYDACATHKNVRYGDRNSPQLDHLTSSEPSKAFERECVAMNRQRSRGKDFGEWYGYLVDCGQDRDNKMWVTEKGPWLTFLYPNALTVYRVSLPLSILEQVEIKSSFFGGSGYLADCREMRIESVLSIRDEKKIPRIESENTTDVESKIHPEHRMRFNHAGSFIRPDSSSALVKIPHC